MKRLYTFLLGVLFAFGALQASVPFFKTRTRVQSDGKTITVNVHLRNDFLIFSTTDGFAVLPNEQGDYTYALSTADGYEAGTVLAHEPADRSAEERAYVANTAVVATTNTLAVNPRSFRSPKFAAVNSDGTGVYGTSGKGTLSSIGTPNIPVIMVEFPDQAFLPTTTEAVVTDLFNKEGYKDDATNRNIRGSIRDYFISQSDGQFKPTFTVVAKVTAKHGYAYYGKNVGSSNSPRAAELVREVVQTAISAGKSFDAYKVASQGGVPLVMIYFAGSGEQNSADATASDRLWAHYMSTTISAGATTIKSYLIGNETFLSYKVNASNTGYETDANGHYIVDSAKTVRDGIGVLCHELGHALGLPDFYTTNKATHNTPDYWSIMDNGIYIANGYAPMGYNAYERNAMGWLKFTDLDETSKACEIYPYGSSSDKPMAYRLVNPNNAKEYLIFENRTKGTWYINSLSGGMLVTRVNYDANTWSNNTVNNSASAMGFEVVPADGATQMRSNAGSDWVSKFQGDLYPGTTAKTEVASWAVRTGSALAKPFYNITYHSDGNIVTFSYLDRDIVSGIEGVVTDGKQSATPVYDLQGRRVTHPSRGLYIIGGRKVFIQ